jgi:hypothetical protein
VFAGIDGGFKMQRAEAWWCCQNHDIAILFKHLCVGIETNELTIFRNVDLIAVLTLQLTNGTLEVIVKRIGDSNKLCRASSVHRLIRSTSTSTTATNETDANGLITVNMSRADGAKVRQDRRSGRSHCGGLQKAAT